MAISLTLTDEDARRYLKWAANIRQPRETVNADASNGNPEVPEAPLRTRRQELNDIRKWARKHGFRIADRGRIPSTVMEAYEAAH